jgi:hypothetical protein
MSTGINSKYSAHIRLSPPQPNPDYVDEDQSAYHGAGGSLVGGVSGNNYYGNIGSLPRSNTYGNSQASGYNGRYQAQGGNSGGYGS